MASEDCTSTGGQIWIATSILSLTALLAELGAFTSSLKTHIDIGQTIIADIIVIGGGNLSGLVIAHQGLTNPNLQMPMRVGLSAIGLSATAVTLAYGLAEVNRIL